MPKFNILTETKRCFMEEIRECRYDSESVQSLCGGVALKEEERCGETLILLMVGYSSGHVSYLLFKRKGFTSFKFIKVLQSQNS